MVQINGPFKDIIPNFQKYKKSLGYKYDNTYKYYRLDKILFDNNIVDLKDSKKIYEVLVTNETNLNKKNEHYSALKELYKYMKLIGYDDLYFEALYFLNTSNFEPTILTKHQLKIFFETLDSFCKKLEYPKCYIYPVLFRLLYSNELFCRKNGDLH